MLLSAEQLQAYEKNGFLLLPNLFSEREVELLRAQLPIVFAEDTPRRVMEKGSNIVRSVYGSHVDNQVYHRLARHPRMVEPAIQILGSPVYVHQFKINAKAAFGGDIWEWHQDYIFWLKEDGMPAAQAINVVVFLDEVTEFNGPLIFIPGSHTVGCIDQNARASGSTNQDDPAWMSNLTADLKYALDKQMIARLATDQGMTAPKGPAGSALLFHPNIIHGSAPNMSPHDRGLIIMTYNSVDNTPLPVAKPRPEFLASRDYRPITPLADGVLLT